MSILDCCVTIVSLCSILCILVFFFFQAEDGIRDLVRSRGLGDVYKRQHQVLATGRHEGEPRYDVVAIARFLHAHRADGVETVSYTHLTLPTSDLV